MLSGGDPESIDGHSIQPYYATLLAKDCGLTIEAIATPDSVTLTATPGDAGSAAGGIRYKDAAAG